MTAAQPQVWRHFTQVSLQPPQVAGRCRKKIRTLSIMPCDPERHAVGGQAYPRSATEYNPDSSMEPSSFLPPTRDRGETTSGGTHPPLAPTQRYTEVCTGCTALCGHRASGLTLANGAASEAGGVGVPPSRWGGVQSK